MEKLFNRAFFALNELNIVDQKHIDFAVSPLELFDALLTNGVDEVIRKFLGIHVAHAHLWEKREGVVADRVNEVGFAQTGITVNKERVVGAPGSFRDRKSCCVGEAIRGTDNESIESVLRVQVGTRGVDCELRAIRRRCLSSRGLVWRGGAWLNLAQAPHRRGNW